MADRQAIEEEIWEAIAEVTEVVVTVRWVSKPLEEATGVEVLGVKVLVLSTEMRGELEEELVAALRTA